jgi:hypothetical protein
VGNDGKSLWIDCRKPAAAAVEKAGIYRAKRDRQCPCRLWIEGGYSTAATLAQNERDRALGTPGPKNAPEMGGYFSELLMLSNFVLSVVPRPFTTEMIAIEIPAAIRPYSMAVAPDSSLKNDLMTDIGWFRPGFVFLEPRLPLQFLPGNLLK